MMSSTLYTMGMALDRAAQNGFTVALLVEGHWLEGQVAAHDGMGVILESVEGMHCVVRNERIAAVKVMAESPYHRTPITDGEDFADEAMPMPGPRFAAV